MKVENGHNVKVHYRGTLSDGSEFDNSRTRGQTLDFEVGTPNIIQGFNHALLGMIEGETKTVTIATEDAYGEVDLEAFQTVPKTAFAPDFVFEVDAAVMGQTPQGPVRAIIQEVLQNEVILDFNHPLAGKDLTFEFELVSIDIPPQMASWNAKMKKAELFEIAKSQGLSVNTRSTKAQIIEALSA
jgi:FKBP-type peptidyl-prolyl cis-trans isomerase 2